LLVFLPTWQASFNNDTECVNGPAWNAEDHPSKTCRRLWFRSSVSGRQAMAVGRRRVLDGWHVRGRASLVRHPEVRSAIRDNRAAILPQRRLGDETTERLSAEALTHGHFDRWRPCIARPSYPGAQGYSSPSPPPHAHTTLRPVPPARRHRTLGAYAGRIPPPTT